MKETVLQSSVTALKAHIIQATMEGLHPVVVSMGTNALSHKWARFSLFQKQFQDTYGSLSSWLRITLSEGTGVRLEDNRALCPQAVNGGFMGFYRSADVVEHEAGRVYNAGVEV